MLNETWWPAKAERKLLGKFYLADCLAELTNVLQPFEFVFLFLIMHKAAWAPIPLLVEGITVVLMEVPTGVIADKFGRKISVILGDLISGIALILVPFAALAPGIWQVVLISVLFALEGIGQTFCSGADEAWVVDNLTYYKKENLIDRFFGRQRSFASMGGLAASIAIFCTIISIPVTYPVLSLIWITTGAGHLVAALILRSVAEHRSDNHDDEKDALSEFDLWKRTREGFVAIFRIKPLGAFLLVMIFVAFATSITGDAFDIALVIRQFDPRNFALLSIATDLLGIATPLIGIAIGRMLGWRPSLILYLTVPLFAVTILFLHPGIGAVVGLYLFFNFVDDLWDPVADARLQSLIPSRVRATVGSIFSQSGELISLVGLAVFTWMLGEEGQDLQEAVPDIISAFSGVKMAHISVPEMMFGLPVSDCALILFTFSALIPIVLLLQRSLHATSRGESEPVESLPASKKPQTVVSVEATPQQSRLIKVKNGLDQLLDKYNPGEQLTWWIAEDAFTIPGTAVLQLQEGGPALMAFFKAANKLFYQDPSIQRRLQKRFSPHYRQLNFAQPDAIPFLLRPDVVINEAGAAKYVELEITVGCRADTSVRAMEYNLDKRKSLVQKYVEFFKKNGWYDKTLALITAPHPFFLDLPDDARAFASMLTREGMDVVVLTKENLGHLVFDGTSLRLKSWDTAGEKRIDIVDRVIDIYEIAELEHVGMGALLDAFCAGAITDVNTFKQFLDEKDWMSLFWDRKLRDFWVRELGERHDAILRRMITRTWLFTPDLVVELESGEIVPVMEIGDILPQHRRFIIKESGTSTTASGAQSFYVLHLMEKDAIFELLSDILESKTEYVLQELVESYKSSFSALDPEDDRVITQHEARAKLSVFYVDGAMTDIRFISSNVKYAVNDVDCVVGVVRY
jgi:MFS family permease